MSRLAEENGVNRIFGMIELSAVADWGFEENVKTASGELSRASRRTDFTATSIPMLKVSVMPNHHWIVPV